MTAIPTPRKKQSHTPDRNNDPTPRGFPRVLVPNNLGLASISRKILNRWHQVSYPKLIKYTRVNIESMKTTWGGEQEICIWGTLTLSKKSLRLNCVNQFSVKCNSKKHKQHKQASKQANKQTNKNKQKQTKTNKTTNETTSNPEEEILEAPKFWRQKITWLEVGVTHLGRCFPTVDGWNPKQPPGMVLKPYK